MDSNAGKLADIRNKLEHGGFRVVVDDLYKASNPFDKNLAETKHAEILSRIEKNKKILKSGIPKAEQQHIREKINADQRLIDERDDLQGHTLIITDKELRDQTLRLMRKVRYAIMYTSLAIHYEEDKNYDSSIVIPYETPMYKN